MKALSFLSNGRLYAADVNLVLKFVRNMMVTPVLAAPDAIVGIANLKGKVITVFSLSELLGNGKQLHTQAINAVILKSETGLIIDAPGDLIDIDDLLIEPPPEENFCISGIAEVEENLYRIIDVDSIINKYNGGAKNA
jgi:purine-binding chemotaxis protein CheW